MTFKLKKITVNAASAGVRIIQLRDMYGRLIVEKQVTMAVGIQDVQLDFFIPVGMNLQLSGNRASWLATY